MSPLTRNAQIRQSVDTEHSVFHGVLEVGGEEKVCFLLIESV